MIWVIMRDFSFSPPRAMHSSGRQGCQSKIAKEDPVPGKPGCKEQTSKLRDETYSSGCLPWLWWTFLDGQP